MNNQYFAHFVAVANFVFAMLKYNSGYATQLTHIHLTSRYSGREASAVLAKL